MIKIAFPVVYQQNQNEQSAAYGKYYPKPYKPDTLSLRGLIERVAMDQSVYSRDIVESVIQRLTKVMVELLQGGEGGEGGEGGDGGAGLDKD